MVRSGSFSVKFHKEDMLIYDDDDEWKFDDEEDVTAEGKQKVIDVENQDLEITGIEQDLFVDHTLSTEEQRSHIWDLNTPRGRLRFKIHLVMDHIAARLFSILLVIIDIILVLVALATSADTKVYSPITLAIVSYFMVELMLRIFSWGREFFHHRLEIIDMVIIIITFIITVVFEIITINEHIKFGKLIVVFRLMRILLLARICTGRKHLEKSTRNLISQNKRRYVKDGFDLDLTYITDRIIAMSFPSSGKTSMYRNPISEVSRFFNTKHADHYKLYNLCSERKYETHWFNESVERVLIDDHNVPRLSQLLQYCYSVDEWMKKDEKNIIAIHCKGGKGRTGTCVAAWMIYSGQFKTAEEALNYFGVRRTDKAKGLRFQGVETPSQSRYVGYLERVLKDMKGRLPTPKPFILKSLKMHGIKNLGNGDGSDFRMEVIINSRVVYELNFNVPMIGRVFKKNDEIKVKFNMDDCPVISGDVKVMFHSSNPNVPKDYDKCAFFFWFHTSFVKDRKLHLTRSQIGNCHKQKHWKTYPERFSITLKFNDPPSDMVEGPADFAQDF